MIWLLGGDPATNEIPAEVAAEFREFLTKMVNENRLLRPSDCWDLHEEETQTKDRLWERKFLHLIMT